MIDLIRNKKKAFQADLVSFIKELESLKESISNSFDKEGLNTVLNRYPILQAKILSAKTAIQLLSELELEFEKLNKKD